MGLRNIRSFTSNCSKTVLGYSPLSAAVKQRHIMDYESHELRSRDRKDMVVTEETGPEMATKMGYSQQLSVSRRIQSFGSNMRPRH